MPVSGLLHRTIGTIRECALITKDILAACPKNCRNPLQGTGLGNRFQGPLTAKSGHSLLPQKIPVSGRSRGHAELAVPVDTRRRHQGGEAVEQLERRPELRATAATARVWVVVDAVLEEFAEPVQGERGRGRSAADARARRGRWPRSAPGRPPKICRDPGLMAPDLSIHFTARRRAASGKPNRAADPRAAAKPCR